MCVARLSVVSGDPPNWMGPSALPSAKAIGSVPDPSSPVSCDHVSPHLSANPQPAHGDSPISAESVILPVLHHPAALRSSTSTVGRASSALRTGKSPPSCFHRSEGISHESGWRDLNPRPLRPERSALPSCATPRVTVRVYRCAIIAPKPRRGPGLPDRSHPDRSHRDGPARPCSLAPARQPPPSHPGRHQSDHRDLGSRRDPHRRKGRGPQPGRDVEGRVDVRMPGVQSLGVGARQIAVRHERTEPR